MGKGAGKDNVVHIKLSNVYIFRFYYLQTCGCVFSERALKEVKTEICHKVRSLFLNLFPLVNF